MRSKESEETESIASFTDSENEVETKVKPKSKMTRPKTPAENLALGLTKTGRVKREMSEAQKKVLAAARVKAREKRKELKEIRDKEKSLKNDDLLIRRLTVEKKVLEHKNMLKNLAIDAGMADESLRPKPKRKPYTHKEKDEDDDYQKSKRNEIAKLQKQLEELQIKHKVVSKKEESSDSESESEEEEIVVERKKKPVKVIRKVEENKEERIPVKKPVFKPDPPLPPESSRKKIENPMKHVSKGNTEDPRLRLALNSLFA